MNLRFNILNQGGVRLVDASSRVVASVANHNKLKPDPSFVKILDSKEIFVIPLKLILTSLLLLFCPLTSFAQEPTTTKKQELIRELLEVTGARDNASKMIDSIVGELSKQYPLIVERLADADSSLTLAQRKEAKKTLGENQAQFIQQLMERIKQRVDVGQIIEGISSSLYDQYFTEDELKDLVGFYKTSTGKKLLSVLPEYFAASIRLTGEKLLPIVTPIIMEIVEEQKGRIKSKKRT